jgi:hypothetical protein
MPFIIKIIVAFALSAIGIGAYQIPQARPDMASTTPTDRPYEAVGGYGQFMADVYRYVPPVTTTAPVRPVYKHGDCSWLPALALKAGWQVDQIPQLTHIALREAGCCVNRKGGDIVNSECVITGVSEYTHRSDTGALQINSINFDISRNPYAPICLKMRVCTQEALLDPLTNLKAGKLLFDYWQKAAGNGWIPWDICNRTKTCK